VKSDSIVYKCFVYFVTRTYMEAIRNHELWLYFIIESDYEVFTSRSYGFWCI